MWRNRSLHYILIILLWLVNEMFNFINCFSQKQLRLLMNLHQFSELVYRSIACNGMSNKYTLICIIPFKHTVHNIEGNECPKNTKSRN